MAGPNPFHYGTPAVAEYFTDRELELEALVSRIRNGVNVVLLSPRRYGKTSLLLKAEAELERDPTPAAIVRTNLLRARDLPALAADLAAAVYRLHGARWHGARQAVPGFLRRLRLRPNVTFDDQGHPRFGFDPGLERPDSDRIIEDLYALIADEAQRRPAALVLDEFQAVTDLGAHVPNLLKALADAHPRVSLVLAGSKRHLMERLVTIQGAPLYDTAQRLALGPIPDDVMVTYLSSRARAAGKPMDDTVAQLVVHMAGPVPNDIQHLAYEAFELAGGEIDNEAVTAGLAQAVAHEASTYAEAFARRSPGQRRVLVALASDVKRHPFSQDFARSVGLAGSNSVKKAIDALADDEVVAERGDRLAVVDPFFAAWLRPDSSGILAD